jgi:hypothetical protein
VPKLPLDLRDDLTGIRLIPASIELLRGQAQLTSILPERSSGSTSPRFSRHSRSRAASSSPIMIRASEPPMKERRIWQVLVFMGGLMASSQIDMSLPGSPYDDLDAILVVTITKNTTCNLVCTR